jgi:REP element-mobilizing transposase RayT
MAKLDYKEFYRRNLPHFQPAGGTFFITFRLVGSIPRAVLERWRVEHAASLRRMKPHEAEPKRGDVRNSRESTQAGGVHYLEQQRRRFAMIEKYLDKAETGPLWLKDTRVADMVSDSLHYRDGKVYRLDAFCVMPNHVHVVFAPLPIAVAHAASLRSVSSSDSAGEGTQAGSVRYVERSLASILHSLKSYTSNQANKLLERRGQFWEHESFDHSIRDNEEWARVIAYVLNNPVKAGLVENWREWRWSYSRFA